MRTPQELFLITARHVLLQPDGTLRTPEAVIHTPSTDPTETTMNVHRLNLTTLQATGQLKADVTNDVVVLRVSGGEKMLVAAGVTIAAETKGTIAAARPETIAKFSDVLVSNEVIVFGYPTSMGIRNIPQVDSSRPLLRSGIVAGVNAPRKTIVLDVPVNPGNSGGPVLQLSGGAAGDGSPRIIGVVTQVIPITGTIPATSSDQKPQQFQVSSGYALAASMDAVLDLISTFESR
jgi:hypothetical protein